MTDPDQTRTHYVHQMKYSTQERVVGVFVLSGIAILIVLLFVSGQTQRLFERRVEYVAFMRNAVGVTTDTKIRISGIEAGSVKNIALNDDSRFKVKLSVYKSYRNLVRVDSTASISKLAFIGDSVINISPGNVDQPLLPDGGVIEVEETLSLDQIIANLKPVLEKINSSIDKIATVVSELPSDALATTLINSAEATDELKQIAGQIADGKGTLGALVYDRQLYVEFNGALQNLRSALLDIQQTAQATRSSAVALPQIIQQISETAEIIRQEISELPELSADTRQLLDDLQNITDAIRYTWPVSSKIKENVEPDPLLDAEANHD